MNFKTLTLFCLSSLLCSLSAAEESNLARTWTSSDGGRTFEGKVVKYDGKQVTIARTGQAPKAFAVDIFSEDDKNWLEENKDLIQNAGTPAPAKKSETDNMVAKQLGELTYSMNEKPGLGGNTSQLWGKNQAKKTAKYYILLYSASWCPPCRQEMPHVVKLYKESIASDPDIDLILCSSDQDSKDMKDWADKEKMTFPILPSDKRKRVPVAAKYAPSGIPSAFLIDASTGEIVHPASGRDLPSGCYNAYKGLKK